MAQKDQQEELEELQRLNETRWDQLQELHEQYVQLSSMNNSPCNPAATLQAEREILPEHTHECDALLNEIQDKHSGDDRFAAELVNKCNQLHELERLFQEKIEFQKELVQKMEHSIAEQVILQNKLKQLHHHDDTPEENDPQQENAILREDLAYVTSLVDPVEHSRDWRLNEVMIRLLEQYMNSPDEPYLSCHNIQKEHVELLKKRWLIETFGENMIRLTEYEQEEE